MEKIRIVRDECRVKYTHILKIAKKSVPFLKTLLCRLVFLSHGIFVEALFCTNNNWHWLLLSPLICLAIETIITIGGRIAFKSTFFWLSGFLYITTIVPVVWLIEIQLLHNDFKTEYKISTPKLGSNFSKEILTEHAIGSFMSKEVGKKVCELGLFIGLIIGR